MYAQGKTTRFGVILATMAFALSALTFVEAADVNYRARAISTLNIERAAADLIDLRVERWSTDQEQESLAGALESEGNHGLAAALADQEQVGWARFDPRGGRGQGRDPRKATLRYAREIDTGDTKEIILITNVYIGFGSNAQGADGAKLAEYPLSFVLLRFKKDDSGGWGKGVGRMFVGAKVKFDQTKRKFVIDEFPNDPVYLKDITVK